jgi:hypothetical protein
VTLDFGALGLPSDISLVAYHYDIAAQLGKIVSEHALLRPCAPPGGTGDECVVTSLRLPAEGRLTLDLGLPAGRYVLIVAVNVESGSNGHGYSQQGFHVVVE